MPRSTEGTQQVNFRAGELLPRLIERGESLGGVASRDLERYYDLLQISLAEVNLSEPEASLICDVLNGFWFTEGFTARDSLLAELLDSLPDYAPKWRVEAGPFVGKLRLLSEGQALAILDAAERFCRGQRPEETTESGLGRVGLIRSGAG